MVPQVTFSATLAGAEKSGIVMVQAVPAELSRSLLSFRHIIDGRDFTAADRYRVILARGVAEKIEGPGWRHSDDDGGYQKRWA